MTSLILLLLLLFINIAAGKPYFDYSKIESGDTYSRSYYKGNPVNEDNESDKLHTGFFVFSALSFLFTAICRLYYEIKKDKKRKATENSNNYTRSLSPNSNANFSNTNNNGNDDVLPKYNSVDITTIPNNYNITYTMVSDNNNYKLPTYEEAMSCSNDNNTTINNNTQ